MRALHDIGLRPSASTPYEQHREYVLAVLSRRCGWLDPSDREAIFHDAYAVFLEKERDGHLDVSAMCAAQVRAYLTQTSLNKAMDESKRAGRRRTVSLDDEALSIDPADPGRGLDERLSAGLDAARVREIVAELPTRQQMIVSLRYFFDRTPDEVQRCLGISERVYRRELERATRHIARGYDLVRRGTFCDSRQSLILAYVSGIAGPRRVADARRHVASCPACAGWVRDLRAAGMRDDALECGPTLARAA
jgi:RNA polymerase sigma factor (sigma-70 family)